MWKCEACRHWMENQDGYGTCFRLTVTNIETVKYGKDGEKIYSDFDDYETHKDFGCNKWENLNS